MDMPLASGILLPTSNNALETDQQAGPSGNVPGNKRKRNLNAANAENRSDRPKGKRVRTRRSNKYSHLTPEEAEERRMRVNKQERIRQKKNSDAIDRLRRLNLPNNPNLPNHKKNSNIYVLSTVCDMWVGLEQKCRDNGMDPYSLKVPEHLKEPESDEAETDDPGLESGPINLVQGPALDVYCGPSQPIGGYKQVSRDQLSTSTIYQNNCSIVPQSCNKLPDVSIHQMYPDGNMHPHNPQININKKVCQMPQNQQPINFGCQSVPGLHIGSKKFMTLNNLGPQAACNKVQHPEHSETGGAIKDIKGNNDVPNNSSNVLMKSSFQVVKPALISRLLGSTPDQVRQTLVKTLSPLGKCLPSQSLALSDPFYLGQSQVLLPPAPYGQSKVLSTSDHSGQLQIRSAPGHSGQLQVLSSPGHSGQPKVLLTPGHSGPLQVLPPPGHSGQLQVLSAPGNSRQPQILPTPGHSGQLQVLSPPCHSGQLQVRPPCGHSGQLQVLPPPGHSGQLQVLSAPGNSRQPQILPTPGHSGQLQVLSPPCHSGQLQVRPPCGHSGQLQVLPPPAQLGQPHIVSASDHFGQTQVQIVSPSDNSGLMTSGTPSTTTLTPSSVTPTSTPDSIQQDSGDTDDESYDWLMSWDPKYEDFI